MAGYDLLSDAGFRMDGRKPAELRRLRGRTGVFGQADGSAYLEQGMTKVLAAVYGPHEARSRGSIRNSEAVIVNCQYSTAVFCAGERKRRPRGDLKSHEMSMHLRQTFEAAIKTELYPRSQIDIYVEVLQADGGNYCACVNAATLALINAGIPLRDYVTACTASLANDTPLADVNSIESSRGGPVLTVAALPRTGEIVLLEMSQRFRLDCLDDVLESALQGCRDVYRILDEMVRLSVSRSSASLDLAS